MTKRKQKAWTIIAILIVAFILFNVWQSTPYYNDLSASDQIFFRQLAENITAGKESGMESLEALLSWENETLSLELPEGYETRKADHRAQTIVSQGYGWCYDRSYVFEILAQSLGYKVRHIALASENGTHALSEVYVDEKWVLFETSRHKVYRDENGVPLGVKELHYRPELLENSTREVYAQFVYGVNSFHGGFADPKIPYPDMAVEQLHYNLAIIPYLPYNFWKVRLVLITLGVSLLLGMGGFVLYRRLKKVPESGRKHKKKKR